MVKTIELTQNQVSLVSDEDYDFLSQWKWCAHYAPGIKGFYALRTQNAGYTNGKRKQDMVIMHRVIMEKIIGSELGSKEVVDHINHNSLDNRRENLRIASIRQNGQNQKRKTSSKYPGVSWNKQQKKWVAQILLNGKKISIGFFDDERTAAKAYEMAQRLYTNTNLVCKQNNSLSYSISDKFTPTWELQTYTSQYKGVDWHKPSKRWRARIMVNGKRKYLGSFTDEEKAAQSYEQALHKLASQRGNKG